MYMVFSLEAHRFTYIPRGSVLLNTCSYIDRGISFAFAFRFVLRNHLHHFVFDSIRKRTLKKKEIGEALKKKKRKNWGTRLKKKKRKRGHWFSFSFFFFSLSPTGAETDRVSDTCSYIDRSRSVDSPRPRNHPFAGGARGRGELNSIPFPRIARPHRHPPGSVFSTSHSYLEI